MCGALGLQFDFDLNAGGKLQGHQGLHRLGRGLDDVDEAFMGAALELLTGVLVLVYGAQDGNDLLLSGQGHGPDTVAPVRLAVSTIFSALWSISWWSYALRRMRIISF